jgi:sulfur carrier protein ThiS
MKVKVRLFGTLSQGFPDYRHSEGMEVEIPEGTTVRDLLTLLQLSESRGAAVAVAGRILKQDDTIRNEVPVHILQVLSGG